MFKRVLLCVGLPALVLAGGVDEKVILGTYLNANGATMQLKKEKGQYGEDSAIHFHYKECDIKWTMKLSDYAKGNKISFSDDQGYGPLLYFKGSFSPEGADMTVTSKFATDNGCQYGVDHKMLSGHYIRLQK